MMVVLLWGAAQAAEPDHRVRWAGGTSFLVAEGDGVPDANRLFTTVGVRLVTIGDTNLAVEPAFAVGYSEGDRISYRVGGNVEAEWVASPLTSLYASTGLHYFYSFTDLETRRGPLWRAALGFRLATSAAGHDRGAYIGFEPLAIERFPNGEGVQTPLRSRWGIEVTFISAGVRL